MLALALVGACRGGGAAVPADGAAPVPIIGGGTSTDCLVAPPGFYVTSPDAGDFVMPEALLGGSPVAMPLTIRFTDGLTGPMRTFVFGDNPWQAGFTTAVNGCDGRFGCLVFGKTPNCSLELVFRPSADMIPATGGKGPFKRTNTVCFEDDVIKCIMVSASFVVP